MKTCFLIFVFSVFIGSAFAVTCQSGWIQNGDDCYQFNVAENVTWTEAMAFCDKERANLVDIDSDVEFNFLDSVLEGFGQLNVPYWVSANDLGTPNEYKWQGDCTDLPDSSYWWSPESPTLIPGSDCVYMVVEFGELYLKDQPCSERASVLCEREAT